MMVPNNIGVMMMRLTDRQKRQVIDACRVTRPDAKLIRRDGQWLVVWFVERDALVNPDVKVSRHHRWRAQLVNGVDRDGSVWWSGVEGHGVNQRDAIGGALA